jgi:hypothetical protein
MENGNKGAFSKADGGRQIGLTKREYFAAAALQGLLACRVPSTTNSEFAERAVILADKLLEELNKSK